MYTMIYLMFIKKKKLETAYNKKIICMYIYKYIYILRITIAIAFLVRLKRSLYMTCLNYNFYKLNILDKTI